MKYFRLPAILLVFAGCASPWREPPPRVGISPERGEGHLRNIRQLTDGGENAEAYFSASGDKLIFQSTRDGRTCDQQFI